MSGRLAVVYDACVLYPAPLRDLLMRLALTDLFRAHWTDLIHEEWMRSLLERRPDLTRPMLERIRDLMNAHARDALVSGFEHLIPALELPDVGDRHVLAAAIHCGAGAIVTFNLSDFPGSILGRHSLRAVHPDAFIAGLMALDAGAVVQAAAEHRASLKRPPRTVEEYLDALPRQGLLQTVEALRRFGSEL